MLTVSGYSTVPDTEGGVRGDEVALARVVQSVPEKGQAHHAVENIDGGCVEVEELFRCL